MTIDQFNTSINVAGVLITISGGIIAWFVFARDTRHKEESLRQTEDENQAEKESNQREILLAREKFYNEIRQELMEELADAKRELKKENARISQELKDTYQRIDDLVESNTLLKRRVEELEAQIKGQNRSQSQQ